MLFVKADSEENERAERAREIASSPCTRCAHGGPDGVCRHRRHRQPAPGRSCSLYAYKGADPPPSCAPGFERRGVCLVDIVTGSVVERWPDAASCGADLGLKPSRVVRCCRSHMIPNRSVHALRWASEYDGHERFAARAPVMRLSARDGALEAVYPSAVAAADVEGISVRRVERALAIGSVVDGSRYVRMRAMGQAVVEDETVRPLLRGFRDVAPLEDGGGAGR